MLNHICLMLWDENMCPHLKLGSILAGYELGMWLVLPEKHPQQVSLALQPGNLYILEIFPAVQNPNALAGDPSRLEET